MDVPLSLLDPDREEARFSILAAMDGEKLESIGGGIVMSENKDGAVAFEKLVIATRADK